LEKINLPDIKHIVAVTGSKGGVGKTMVSANLAVALAQKGYKTALADADIYSPGIPDLFAIADQTPDMIEFHGMQFMLPLEKHGVKINSMGFFAPPKKGMIWRGAMASAAISQMLQFTHWEETDFLIIDLPPGNGDIHLLIHQQLNLTGFLLVTTPRQPSLADGAAAFFTNAETSAPVIGVIENMSWFSPAAHPEEKYYLFGKHGGSTLADELNVPLLAQIPLMAETGETAERNLPLLAESNPVVINIFRHIAQHIESFAALKSNSGA
jgi:ATP-binding protein involved in chromosome partitioning